MINPLKIALISEIALLSSAKQPQAAFVNIRSGVHLERCSQLTDYENDLAANKYSFESLRNAPSGDVNLASIKQHQPLALDRLESAPSSNWSFPNMTEWSSLFHADSLVAHSPQQAESVEFPALLESLFGFPATLFEGSGFSQSLAPSTPRISSLVTTQTDESVSSGVKSQEKTVTSDDLVALGHKLGGSDIAAKLGVLSYSKTSINPKTGAESKRFFTIYTPDSTSSRELRAMLATLKGGNPSTYGSPDKQNFSVPSNVHVDSDSGSVAVKRTPTTVQEIFNKNYVIKVCDAPHDKFGALAVVHHDKHSIGDGKSSAYIGQVVNGARNIQAGANKPLLGSEKDLIVKGGGSQAVLEALSLAAHLGHESARLYTNSPGLGKRQSIKSDEGVILSKPTFYENLGHQLGLQVGYVEVNHMDAHPVKKTQVSGVADGIVVDGMHQSDLPLSTVTGKIGQESTYEFHYSYNLKPLRDAKT